MIAQADTGILVSVGSIIIVINGGAIGFLWRQMNKIKEEYNEEKKEFQTTNTCIEIVKRIDSSAEERHQATLETLKRIEKLIINNGNPTPRVQT